MSLCIFTVGVFFRKLSTKKPQDRLLGLFCIGPDRLHLADLVAYGQSPWPDLKPRLGSQEVPELVHVKAALPATNVGVLTVVKLTPAVVVAPVVM
ncbi:MAG: hypothetical protein ABFR65_07165, partial [Pseudomonadota bacterium]